MSFLSFLPLIGTALSGALGFASQAKTNADQMKLAEYQYSKNLEMWNRNNEYNTPIAQRERMEAAGFNPNLVYGHGSVVNTSSSVPQYSAPTLQAYTQFGNLGQDYLDGILSLRKNIAEVNKIEAEAQRAKNLARKDAVDADNAVEFGRESAKADLDNKIFTAQLMQSKAKVERDIAWYSEAIAYNENQKKFAEVELLIAKKKEAEKQLESLDSIIALNKSSKDLNIAKIGLTKAQTVTEGYRPQLINTQSEYYGQLKNNEFLRSFDIAYNNAMKKIDVDNYEVFKRLDKVKLRLSAQKIAEEIYNVSAHTRLSKAQINKLGYDLVLDALKYELDVDKYDLSLANSFWDMIMDAVKLIK